MPHCEARDAKCKNIDLQYFRNIFSIFSVQVDSKIISQESHQKIRVCMALFLEQIVVNREARRFSQFTGSEDKVKKLLFLSHQPIHV